MNSHNECMLKWITIIILLVFITCYIPRVFNEQFSYSTERTTRPNNTEYDINMCYINRARPYVISNNKSTADCVVLGLNTTSPNWMLPITNPENPAYYNEFPSHPIGL